MADISYCNQRGFDTPERSEDGALQGKLASKFGSQVGGNTSYQLEL